MRFNICVICEKVYYGSDENSPFYHQSIESCRHDDDDDDDCDDDQRIINSKDISY